MKIYGLTITDVHINAMRSLMMSGRFRASDVTGAAVAAGVPRELGTNAWDKKFPAHRAADRMIQIERKAGSIRRYGRGTLWEPIKSPYLPIQAMSPEEVAKAADGVGQFVSLPMDVVDGRAELMLKAGWTVKGYGIPPYGDKRAIVFEVTEGANAGKQFWYHWHIDIEDTNIRPR